MCSFARYPWPVGSNGLEKGCLQKLGSLVGGELHAEPLLPRFCFAQVHNCHEVSVVLPAVSWEPFWGELFTGWSTSGMLLPDVLARTALACRGLMLESLPCYRMRIYII